VIATRRKYQFRTRQAAEDAARHCADGRDLNSVAFNAAITGQIKWLGNETFGDGANGHYRFGVIPRFAETIIVVVFYCPATGQSPHACAYHEEWLQAEIDRWAGSMPDDKLQRQYREGLYAVRQLVNDTRP